MTTALTSFSSTETRLRTVLRVDGAVTAIVGVLALESPTSWYGSPGWLVRTIGVVLVVTGLEIGLLSRARGRVLSVGTTVTMELAFAWVAATVALLTLRDVPAAGTEVLGLVGLVTLGFGLAYARLRS